MITNMQYKQNLMGSTSLCSMCLQPRAKRLSTKMAQSQRLTSGTISQLGAQPGLRATDFNSSSMGFPYALGFLEARRLASKNEHQQRESQVDIVLSFMTPPQVTKPHFHLILWVQIVIKAHLRRHGQAPALDGVMTIIWKNIWDRKYCCSHFWKTLSTIFP